MFFWAELNQHMIQREFWYLESLMLLGRIVTWAEEQL